MSACSKHFIARVDHQLWGGAAEPEQFQAFLGAELAAVSSKSLHQTDGVALPENGAFHMLELDFVGDGGKMGQNFGEVISVGVSFEANVAQTAHGVHVLLLANLERVLGCANVAFVGETASHLVEHHWVAADAIVGAGVVDAARRITVAWAGFEVS